ncbi:B3 domain-containing protein [Macleaya cordata]|uniref:B3 domain-containing protein n=1 Tax=Macleaya cordata TaxID=56857 RepID=A0A200QX46_MACCD|nr:B3 domain-containing protein [Macleaya cordata]
MPIDLKQAITELGGTTPVWVAVKALTTSDTNPKLGRLFIPPCGETLEEFLTAEEKEKLINLIDDSKGLKALVVDTSGQQFDIDLRIWGSFSNYVLARNRNKMVKRMEMKPKSDAVQLWCFRLPAKQDSKLCFATNIERGDRNTEEDILEALPA